MTRRSVELDYFEWLFTLVCKDRYAASNSYRMLLWYLHDVEFTYTNRGDADRAGDGIYLRYRFACDIGRPSIERYLDGPCSVLEMLVALAIRCEVDIMDDPKVGDRTSQWFWKMITNLGLGSMTDRRFDEQYVEEVVDRFLNREYEPDGRGGLFIVENCEYDLRDADIWHQLCFFLDTMI